VQDNGHDLLAGGFADKQLGEWLAATLTQNWTCLLRVVQSIPSKELDLVLLQIEHLLDFFCQLLQSS